MALTGLLARLKSENEEAHLLKPFSEEEAGISSQQCSSCRGANASTRLRRTISQCLHFMKPSFLGRTIQKPVTDKTSIKGEGQQINATAKRTNSTEYLDGIRGLASFFVFNHHWSLLMFKSVNSGYGVDDNHKFVMLLPFIRLIHSGAAMVSVFFVVSGFVLSHRFIQRMHRHQYPELFNGLVSITFRRPIRLFVPAMVASFGYFLAVSIGIVEAPDVQDGMPFHHGLAAYVDYLGTEFNPWSWKTDVYGFYGSHLWSIVVEFRGSMVVFLLLLGLAKARCSVRMIAETLVFIHTFANKRWDLALFIGGMLLAELTILFPKPTKNVTKTKVINMLLLIALIIGLYLMGFPRDHNVESPGWEWTDHVWPHTKYRRRFWLATGALLTVFPIAFLPSVQAIFLARPMRYLGRVSFALYLVHGLLNKVVGTALLSMCASIIGDETAVQYNTSFVVATILYYPFVFWVADMFWRGVDVPSITLGKWVEQKCTSPEPFTS